MLGLVLCTIWMRSCCVCCNLPGKRSFGQVEARDGLATGSTICARVTAAAISLLYDALLTHILSLRTTGILTVSERPRLRVGEQSRPAAASRSPLDRPASAHAASWPSAPVPEPKDSGIVGSTGGGPRPSHASAPP